MKRCGKCDEVNGSNYGIGFWRMPFMEAEMGASGVDSIRKIKRALDPKGILNRGKLIEDGK